MPFRRTRGSGRYGADWVICDGAVPGPVSGDRDAGGAYVPIWGGSVCVVEGCAARVLTPNFGFDVLRSNDCSLHGCLHRLDLGWRQVSEASFQARTRLRESNTLGRVQVARAALHPRSSRVAEEPSCETPTTRQPPPSWTPSTGPRSSGPGRGAGPHATPGQSSRPPWHKPAPAHEPCRHRDPTVARTFLSRDAGLAEIRS